MDSSSIILFANIKCFGLTPTLTEELNTFSMFTRLRSALNGGSIIRSDCMSIVTSINSNSSVVEADWTCKCCTFINYGDKEQCRICGAPKGSEPVGPIVTESGAIDLSMMRDEEICTKQQLDLIASHGREARQQTNLQELEDLLKYSEKLKRKDSEEIEIVSRPRKRRRTS